jgi:DNA-directed RNA polymerase II subunit RPB1
VFYSSSAPECKVISYDKQTGKKIVQEETWMIQTDGVDLARVLSLENVDARKTTSNYMIEILQVLGIEAARNSLISELRMILGTYGIYVNYRHMCTLVDVMTQRGIFTSITRHGINRVNSGPLRKCSFEETTEILLEAAFFGEHDTCSGISENVIFGQLA